MAYSAAQRSAMAKAGTAMPDGSFPIANEADLKSAILVFDMNKAAQSASVKSWILKRADDLNLKNLIPSTW